MERQCLNYGQLLCGLFPLAQELAHTRGRDRRTLKIMGCVQTWFKAVGQVAWVTAHDQRAHKNKPSKIDVRLRYEAQKFQLSSDQAVAITQVVPFLGISWAN